MATRYIMTHEVIRQEEARLLGRFEAYPVNGRKTNTGTIKMIRKEIGNMTFRIARKCNVSVNYPRWSIQGKKEQYVPYINVGNKNEEENL